MLRTQMQPVSRITSASLASVFIFLTSLGAAACQPPEEKPAQQRLDESIGVIRAKVMGADVLHAKELGIVCDSVICDMLEVRLQILEVFKGDPGEFETIHASVPTMCIFSVNVGWEYVLFLEEFRGLIVPNDGSFGVRVAGETRGLTELRNLIAK